MEPKEVTDTIEFILHIYKPKDRGATYARAVYYITPQKNPTEQYSLREEIS